MSACADQRFEFKQTRLEESEAHSLLSMPWRDMTEVLLQVVEPLSG